MALVDQLEADLSVFFNTNDFADYVSYEGADVMAIVELGETEAKGNGVVTDAESDFAQIWVKASDIPAPKPNDVINNWRRQTSEVVALNESDSLKESADAAIVLMKVMGGNAWRVVRTLYSDGYVHRLLCRSNSRIGTRGRY